jgi:hypothetical protein
VAAVEEAEPQLASWGIRMRRLKIGAGPLVALVLALSSVSYVVTAYVAQLETEVELQTSLPLARI